MLMFSKEEYSKEYALKVKFEDEYFAKKKLNESIIEKFSQETPEIIIDARDSEYIWCKAEIIAVIESKEKDNSILVHYCGWGRKYDEVLPLNSPRIANVGFYTSRTDIPYYQSTDNKAKKPVLNMPISNEKIDIIEELKKDCMRDNDDEDENKRRIGEPGEEPLNEEEVYDYLIDKVSNRNRSAHSREPFRLNTQTTSVFDLNPFERSNRDVRIRVNTNGLNRLRGMFNRNHF